MKHFAVFVATESGMDDEIQTDVQLKAAVPDLWYGGFMPAALHAFIETAPVGAIFKTGNGSIVRVLALCPDCLGHGYRPDLQYMRHPDDPEPTMPECPTCNGTGYRDQF